MLTGITDFRWVFLVYMVTQNNDSSHNILDSLSVFLLISLLLYLIHSLPPSLPLRDSLLLSLAPTFPPSLRLSLSPSLPRSVLVALSSARANTQP